MMVDNWQWYVGCSKSSDEFDSTGWSVSLFLYALPKRNVFSCLSSVSVGWWPTIGPIVFAILLRLAQLMHWAWNVGISFLRNWGLVEEAGDFGNQSRSQIVDEFCWIESKKVRYRTERTTLCSWFLGQTTGFRHQTATGVEFMTLSKIISEMKWDTQVDESDDIDVDHNIPRIKS